MGSESVILPRSLDQTGQQLAGKQTLGPIQVILLKSITLSKGRPTMAEMWRSVRDEETSSSEELEGDVP